MDIGKGIIRKRERKEVFQKEEDDEVIVVVEEEEEKSKFEGLDDENALPRIIAPCHREI